MTDTAVDTTTVETTLDTYFAAWNDTDETSRARLVADVFADDARYVDPLSDAAGHDAISAMMGAAHEQYPGMTVQRTSPVDVHHDIVRFSWSITTADGSALIDGIDVARFDADGTLADVRGFFGAVIA